MIHTTLEDDDASYHPCKISILDELFLIELYLQHDLYQ